MKEEGAGDDDGGDLLQRNYHFTTRAPSQPLSIRSTPGPSSSATAAPAEIAAEMDSAEEEETMQALAGQSSRQLIRGIHNLEALGIDNTLPLPKFVVIGDQSAGKSSIIEALSYITLPRSEGTCTRCPFKITTTASKNDQPWQCAVSLHRRYAYYTAACAGENGCSFDNWQDLKDLSVDSFVTVYDKAELESTLRRAQLAILNPNLDPRSFVQMPLIDVDYNEQKVGFSPNVINLEITAPNVPELSFYDLPGAVNTFGDETQQYLVDFVEALLKSYIGEDKTYILLACAADQELENSTALRFVRECRATSRCMGILTKPDLAQLTNSKVSYIRGLLQGGKNYQIGDGWFTTLQPSQSQLERGVTREEARVQEAAFFDRDPWNSLLGDFKHRFGIVNLQLAIAKKLTEHILHNLPEIMERVVARRDAIDKELARFPERAAAPSLEVMTEINNISKAIRDEINPDSPSSDFRELYRNIFRNFNKSLKELKPMPTLSTPGYVQPSITVDSDDTAEDSPTAQKARRLNNGRSISATPVKSSAKRIRRTPAKNESPKKETVVTKVGFRLDEVKRRLDAAPGADIPDQVSEAVTRSMILESVSSWKPATVRVIKRVESVFREMLQKTISTTLAQRLKTELFRQTTEISTSLLAELMHGCGEIVTQIMEAEAHRPLTYNGLITQRQSSQEALLLNRRAETRVEEHYDSSEAQGYKVPSKPDQKKKASDKAWVNSALGVDEYESAVKAAAVPVAYYEIAQPQFVDSIAKQFQYGLIHCFEERLYPKLVEELRTLDSDHCATLLTEDPEREKQRTDLLAERAKLRKALEELNGLPVAAHA